MHVILTHEQADFDALASLFGAHLLNEQAVPVLPRRVNRNLRAFLTLYGREFPFVDPRDLPGGKIESVTLVDTQSLVTLKGMGKATRIRVVDHHPLRDNLPDDWQVTVEEIGATDTLLVENLRERNEHLSIIHATLLLLGIYEDTGSLTYASVTARDVRAAAWLLERGANLKIAVEFLNPPLSPAQREVYERLVADAETHNINGHHVVVACGDALTLEEEVSSLAHKLRDLLDPDALFVLVSTVEGIRLVARSTTDKIDVGEIASRFGGGGHDRAAAALIRGAKPEALSETREQLLELLPRYVQPSVTVAEIMSRGPQLLSPETPVDEVLVLMQRYGYEGYPIVENGRVVGLLTRHAVDRAISHKLTLTAASLMEAGEVTVSPDDSLQTLQTRMTDSGWGQIPVVEEGQVIGIVTRTDLLKTLAPHSMPSGGTNMAERLEEALPEARLALMRAVAEGAAEQKAALYVVGGFVRDLLLDRPSLDFDMVVEGDAIALARALAEKHGGRVTTHSRFGTAKWFLEGSRFKSLKVEGGKLSNLQLADLPAFLDFISARTEFYARPTALPTVSRGSIKLDLHRRDFTINTLALRLDGRHYGELHDYWGGLADLERGLVRVLHSLSFVDDPTRMLRAVRFEQRFGFKLGVRTQQLMDEARPLLGKLSGDRVRHELDLILDEPRTVAMFSRLADLGLLKAISPSLPWDDGLVDRLNTALNTPQPKNFGDLPEIGDLPRRRALGYLVWLLPLPLKDLRAVAKRLRFHASLKRALLEAGELCADLHNMEDAKISAWAARLDGIPLLALYAAYLCAPEEKIRQLLASYLAKWRHVQPTVGGNDLRARGLAPSPRYKKILSRLRAAWLDGEIKTKEEEGALLERMLKE